MTLVHMDGKPPNEKRGRPTKLTPELQADILAAVMDHQPVAIALSMAGCSLGLFYNALQTGARAEQKLQEGAELSELSDHERNCADFVKAYVQAEAVADATATKCIVDAAENVQVTEKTAVKYVGKDEEGKPIMVTEKTITKAPGDWRAMAWYQEHKPYTKWKQASRLEITGKDGGPVAVEFATRLEEIAARIKNPDAIAVESVESTPEDEPDTLP